MELRNTAITGTIERYTFQGDNDYCVVKLQERDKRDLTTGIGHLPSVPIGSTVHLNGMWVTHSKFGPQFKFEGYQLVKPNTLNGLEKYLGSGLIKGIGPKYAAQIVEVFGLETLDIIEVTPDRLLEVKGLGNKRAESIKNAWAEQKDIQEIMIFLQGEGISSTYAIKIYKQYGKDSIARVKENPYQLAEDIWGVGFKIADNIAASVGIPRDSPLRIKSGILHTLTEASGAGHCFLPEEDLIKNASEILELPPEAMTTHLFSLAETQKVVINEGKVYLARLHYAETGIATRIVDLSGRPSQFPAIDIEKAITWAEGEMGFTFADAQVDAIKTVLYNKVNILTGGPGTGKTTILKAILLILQKKGTKIALAAPTGRAAKRMSEMAEEEAKTIHRLLEYDPATHGFKRYEENPLNIDLLVVDESSMLDVLLCNSLLKAVPPEASILFVGDVDQLPSVGAGNVLKDLIASRAIPVVRLTQIFRQGEGSLISLNAYNINRGYRLALESGYTGAKDFYCIFKDEPEEILSSVLKLCGERLPNHFGLDPLRDIQVLTPMHKGIIGTGNLNESLQKSLNPRGASLTRGTKIMRVGDKVMQIRNNYDKDVFNGDIGCIKGIDEEERSLSVDYDGRVVEYDYGSELDELILSYACSIHKSQGSEYPCVIIPLHTTHYMMLQRNLLYTAVTRGKKLVIIVGSKKALAISIKNNKPVDRYTSLSHFISDLAPSR